MIIVLLGADGYRRSERERELRERFMREYPGAGISMFDATHEKAEELLAAFADARSLFAPRMLGCLRGLSARKAADLSGVLRRIAQSDHETTLVISEDDLPASYAFLEEVATVEPFPTLEGVAWKQFVHEETTRRGVPLSPDAESLLAHVYEEDPWALITELEQLALLGDEHITPARLAELGIAMSPEFQETLGAFRAASVRVRLGMLERILAAGEPTQPFFYMLAYQGGNAPQFARYDLAIKTGKIGFEEALLDYVIAPGV